MTAWRHRRVMWAGAAFVAGLLLALVVVSSPAHVFGSSAPDDAPLRARIVNDGTAALRVVLTVTQEGRTVDTAIASAAPGTTEVALDGDPRQDGQVRAQFVTESGRATGTTTESFDGGECGRRAHVIVFTVTGSANGIGVGGARLACE